MKRSNKSIIAWGVALCAVLVWLGGCLPFPKTDFGFSQFVFELFRPRNFTVDDLHVYDITANNPIGLLCAEKDGKLEARQLLHFEGFTYITKPILGDESYSRRVPVLDDQRSKKKYAKYYFPDRPIYWEFVDLSITSDNASFGADYPPGSDLTPIFVFKFQSLYEFIKNGYTGSFTTEHIVRANDREAWAALELFETGTSGLTIERVPTAVSDGDMPRIHIRLRFLDKGYMLKQTVNVRPPVENYDGMTDLSVTLLINIA